MPKFEFTQAQQDVIRHAEGPLLVTAGPGSGKTTVLTYRLVSMIRDHKIDPERILVITLTRAAAEEMRQRFPDARVLRAPLEIKFRRQPRRVQFIQGEAECVLRRRSKAARLSGLGILAASVVKLLLFDTASLATPGRVGVFAAVGALLIAGAFLYLKFKPFFEEKGK